MPGHSAALRPRVLQLDESAGIRAALLSAQEARHQARRAQRQVSRAGSRNRRAGRAARHRDDRHQHGRPRHRHPARRQRRAHGASAGLAEEVAEQLPKGEEKYVDDEEFVYFFHVDASTACQRADWERIFAHFKQPDAKPSTRRSSTLGGLHILGTERHEARRIDNQLRGRAGRQGDPGSSRFYLSLEDDLMRIFGSDRISGLMQRLGMEEGVPIEHGMVTRAIERAQKQVEAQNFSRPQAPARVRRRDEQAA